MKPNASAAVATVTAFCDGIKKSQNPKDGSRHDRRQKMIDKTNITKNFQIKRWGTGNDDSKSGQRSPSSRSPPLHFPRSPPSVSLQTSSKSSVVSVSSTCSDAGVAREDAGSEAFAFPSLVEIDSTEEKQENQTMRKPARTPARKRIRKKSLSFSGPHRRKLEKTNSKFLIRSASLGPSDLSTGLADPPVTLKIERLKELVNTTQSPRRRRSNIMVQEHDGDAERLHERTGFLKHMKLRSFLQAQELMHANKDDDAAGIEGDISTPSGQRQCMYKMEKFVKAKFFRNVVVGLILLNLTFLIFDVDFSTGGYYYYRIRDAGLHSCAHEFFYDERIPGKPDFEAAYILSVYFEVIDKIFTILFTVEIVLKLVVFRCKFFNVFTNHEASLNIVDTIVVLVADIDLFLWIASTTTVQIDDSTSNQSTSWLALLKMLRALRVLRLANQSRNFRTLMHSCLGAISTLVLPFIVGVMFFYVGGILATKALGHAPDVGGRPGDLGTLNLFPANDERTGPGGQGNGLFSGPGVLDYGQSSYPRRGNELSRTPLEMQLWFGTILRSMYTLFQIMTLESWSMGIVRVVQESWSWWTLFFVLWILIMSFMYLSYIASIFVAKLLETKDDLKDKESAEFRKMQVKFKQHLWRHFREIDTDQDEMITLEQLESAVTQNVELRNILQQTGWITNASTVKHLFEVLDSSGSGQLHLNQWMDIASVFGEEIFKEHIFKMHATFVRRLKEIKSNLVELTSHVETAVGHGSSAELLEEEPDTVFVTERMQRDKEIVAHTVSIMLQTLDKAPLRSILKRMETCGMNPRTRKRVHHKILTQHTSSTIKEPSAAKSRKASLAMLGKLLPAFLPSNKASASPPPSGEADSTGTKKKLLEQDVSRKLSSSGGSLPKYLTSIQSSTPAATKAAGVALTKSARKKISRKISRAGTQLSLAYIDQEADSTSSTTTSGSITQTDSPTLADGVHPRIRIARGESTRSILLSNITNVIQKIVLWSHPN